MFKLTFLSLFVFIFFLLRKINAITPGTRFPFGCTRFESDISFDDSADGRVNISIQDPSRYSQMAIGFVSPDFDIFDDTNDATQTPFNVLLASAEAYAFIIDRTENAGTYSYEVNEYVWGHGGQIGQPQLVSTATGGASNAIFPPLVEDDDEPHAWEYLRIRRNRQDDSGIGFNFIDDPDTLLHVDWFCDAVVDGTIQWPTDPAITLDDITFNFGRAMIGMSSLMFRF